MNKLIKTSLSIIVILFTALTFSSCEKAAKAIVNTYVNKMSATVNGSAFTSTNTNVTKSSVSGGTQITIDGTSSTGQRITIAIINYIGATGNYSVNGGSGTAIAAYNSGSGSDLIGTTGQVSITNIDNTTYTNGAIISGIFNFTTTGNTITSGTFSVFVSK